MDEKVPAKSKYLVEVVEPTLRSAAAELIPKGYSVSDDRNYGYHYDSYDSYDNRWSYTIGIRIPEYEEDYWFRVVAFENDGELDANFYAPEIDSSGQVTVRSRRCRGGAQLQLNDYQIKEEFLHWLKSHRERVNPYRDGI